MNFNRPYQETQDCRNCGAQWDRKVYPATHEQPSEYGDDLDQCPRCGTVQGDVIKDGRTEENNDE